MNEEMKKSTQNFEDAVSKMKVPDSLSMEDIVEAAETNSKAVWTCFQENVKLGFEFLKKGL